MNIQQAIQDRGVWKKITRYGLKPLAWVMGVLLLIWAVFWTYVATHEEDLKKRVSNAIHEKTRGEVRIGELSVSFFRTFPLLSLQLHDVLLRDSLGTFTHKDFLKASDIYLRVSVPGLITGNSPVGKILIRNGEINIATDTSGNTNEYIFKTKPREGRPVATSFPDVELQNVSATYLNPRRKKDYSAIINSVKLSAKDRNGMLHLKANVRMLVRNLAFNTVRGAYLKDKILQGKFELDYKRETKDLYVDDVKLYLDNHPYFFNGQFNLQKDNGNFKLDITSNDVSFSSAASMLTSPIQKAMKPYSIAEPVNVVVKLEGQTVVRSSPRVQAFIEVRENTVTTPQGVFEDCSFDGFFTNETVPGKPREDPNSHLLFKKFSGRWENINLESDTIKISNLIKPYLECDVAAVVDMKTLNKLAGSETFQFQDGKTSFDIDFEGPINGDDSAASNINGKIDITKASFKYIPRNLVLSDCNGNMKFVNNDLFVNKLNANIGKTKLLMNGSAKNFLSMLNVSPEKLLLRWQINSPELHLDDFKPLLSSSKGQQRKEQKRSGKIAQTSSRIDKMFSDGNMYISLDAPEMDYKTFKATGVKADVVFTPSEIRLERVMLDHADGSMQVSGKLLNGTDKNPVSLNVNMNRMDVPKLFTAFDNFGQDAITNKNLKGRLSAKINYKTAITNKATLIPAESDGSIQFLLEGGELNNFEPLQEISQKAFKKQDFSQIRFADLQNRLDLKGTTFIIHSMDIRSTALNFSFEGVYDFKKGTDMFIKLPLRNILRSQSNTDISDEGKAARGVSLRLRAKTGDDGKLKVSWDPLRLAKRNKKDVIDSAETKN